MTAEPTPEGSSPDQVGRVDNGLAAPSYVPLTDVDATVGGLLLTALGRARIAAYLAPQGAAEQEQRRLFVAADERSDARTIVAAAIRAMGGPPGELPERSDDPLAGVDTDAEFAALIADWHVDTVAAVREAERDFRREDADWRARLHRPALEQPVWLDDDHYVPPPPPPLPRLAAATIAAMTLLAVSLVLLVLGSRLGLGIDLTLLLGIGGLLLSAGLLIMRLHEHGDDDDDDDGAVV